MKLTNITENKVIGVLGVDMMPGMEISRPRDKFVVKVDKTDEYGDVIRKKNGTPYWVETLIPSIKCLIDMGMLRLDGELELEDEYEAETKASAKAEEVPFMPEPENIADAPTEEAPVKKTRKRSAKTTS